MGMLNRIPRNLTEKRAPSAGVRNRLVYEYDVLDHALVLSAVQRGNSTSVV